MDKIQITLVNEKQTVWVDKGVTLLDVQVEAGLHPDAPCGGQGTCGKCLVDIRTDAQAPWQRVKACQTKVEGPLELKTLPRDQQLRVLDEGAQEQADGTWTPWVEQVAVQVAPCPLGESTADWSRLKEALACATGRPFWAPDVQIASYGRKCFLDPDNPHEEDIALAHEALKKAEQWMLAEDTDIMILDEINNALFFKLLTIEEVLAFVDQKPKHVELVMTGRNAPEELQARADYVTEMREIKHPYTTSGQGSRKGIEF